MSETVFAVLPLSRRSGGRWERGPGGEAPLLAGRGKPPRRGKSVQPRVLTLGIGGEVHV